MPRQANSQQKKKLTLRMTPLTYYADDTTVLTGLYPSAIYTPIDLVIYPYAVSENTLFRTGVAVEAPIGYEVAFQMADELVLQTPVRVAPNVIYDRREACVVLNSLSSSPFTLKRGLMLGRFVLVPSPSFDVSVVKKEG